MNCSAFNEHTNTLKETAHGINIDTILPPSSKSPYLSLIFGLHKFHTHTQIPCQGCNGHTLRIMEAGATEWTKLYGNAYIRLNIAVFWDIMLCHWVSLFLMLLKTYF
jgi:hypothetical protein